MIRGGFGLWAILPIALPWPHLTGVHRLMLCSFSRRIATLIVVVLMTAVNGGALAFASNWDAAPDALDTSQFLIEISAMDGPVDQLHADERADNQQARQNAPTCKAGSSDCGGPLPTVDAVSGGAGDLWALFADTAHHNHLHGHNLRPPRI